MSVQLADIIDVLDAAYPPQLAQDWDSVGLVCGDPAETVETVTIAVDATAAVVAEVPDRGLLLAHHPLLLRGVDTVAASTAKGALVHQLIRTGRSLFTAHTNADAASAGRLWLTSRGTSAGCGARWEPSSHQGHTSPGGRNRMPAVNDVGKPCAGEPHARFDAAGAGVATA